MKLELTGQRFGRLTVLRRVKLEGSNNAMWECLCDCGNLTIAAASNIKNSTRSCGCLARETAADLLRGNTNTLKHGLAKSTEYRAWCKLKMRCYCKTNPKYPLYGARGISVCDRWRDSFENFYTDMGPKPSKQHSIERKNNNGNYEPKNCIWALPIVQNRNNRQNHKITIDGKCFCINEWCDILNVPRWKPWEMTRNRGAKRNIPPAYKTIEEALKDLFYKQL